MKRRKLKNRERRYDDFWDRKFDQFLSDRHDRALVAYTRGEYMKEVAAFNRMTLADLLKQNPATSEEGRGKSGMDELVAVSEELGLYEKCP